ncbi:MAG: hypothetical protein RIQ89_2213 [Bacteroidota bacterium]
MVMRSHSQTNPLPVTLPYCQSFGNNYFGLSGLPSGFAIWRIGAPATSIAAAASSIPTADETGFDTATIVKAAGKSYGYSGQMQGVNLNDGKFYIQTSSNNPSGTNQLVLAISTLDFENIKISYDVEMINPQLKAAGIVLQYRVGSTGSWTTVDDTYYYNCSQRFQGQLDYFNNLILPAAASNQNLVQLRWASHRSNVNGSGSCGAGSCGFAIDNILINADYQPTALHYRTKGSGNWNNVTRWESSNDGITWSPAMNIPSSGDKSITIKSGHRIETFSNRLLLDEVLVESGATLVISYNTLLGIADGSGLDLMVEGTVIDSALQSVIWSNEATWQLAPNANFVKCTNTNSTTWQLKFNTGIANIPASSNWICRKYSGALFEPAISSTNGGPPNPRATYGNLIIENFDANWNPYALCKFSGSVNMPLIKGNFIIGGDGTSPLTFVNQNSHSTPITVMGHVIVNSNCTLRVEGTGFDLKQNIECNGLITHSMHGSSVSRLQFTGSTAQSVFGSGQINMARLTINKPSDELTLNTNFRVDGLLTFTQGIINTSNTGLLILNALATATPGNNLNFVRGPMEKIGTTAFSFPVGKNNDIQTCSVGSAVNTTVFWTENFNNGCSNGCDATTYSGPNGSWSITNMGANGTLANKFFVSGGICGGAAGSCSNSNSCSSDATLHIGSNDGINIDLGSYNNSTFDVTTNVMAASPVINCSGKSNVMLSFSYVEGGNFGYDNASLMYFDGSAWSSLFDLPKTTICTSVRSLITSFTIYLPPSANNNPNVKIGFLWVNNNDAIGTNPGFMVDNISLSAQMDRIRAEYFKANPQGMYGNMLAPGIDHISSCEYWMIERLSGTADRTVGLAWDGNSCGVSNLSQLIIARNDNPIWTNQGNAGTTGSTFAGTITSVSQQEFGPYTLASTTSNNPLPVSLLSFTATPTKNAVALEWITASETNNDYFLVERSIDGIHFEKLAQVDGSGNSTVTLTYGTLDESPKIGINYYRLKQVDYDGTENLSQIIPVKFADSRTMALVTFQIGNHLQVEFDFTHREDAKLTLFNANGAVVANENISTVEGHNKHSMPITNLSSGIYQLQLSTVGSVKTQKVILH